MQTPGGFDQAPPYNIQAIWKVVTWAGLLGSIYYVLCVNGAPRIKFLTEMGATARDFGIISGIGSFALIFQIAGSMLGNRLIRRKPVWMALAIAHRIVFLGVIAAPILFGSPSFRILWIILVLGFHDAIAQLSAPLWLAWMADLVPRDRMTRHWASRQRFIQAANILVMMVLAVGFNYFEETQQVVLGFTIISLLGVVLGVIDIFLFRMVPERAQEPIRLSDWRTTLTQPLRDRKFRPYVFYAVYWNFAVFFAAPFFGLYLIDSLELSVLTVQMLGASAALGVALSSRFWGLLCDTYGFKPILHMLTSIKLLTPLSYLLLPNIPGVIIPCLIVLNFFDGAANSGMFLAMQGVLLKTTPRRNRTMYIAATNFLAVGVMATIAPVIAGTLIDFLNAMPTLDVAFYRFNGFHAMFLVSVLLRSFAFLFAARLHEDAAVPVREVIRGMRPWRLMRASSLTYTLHEAPQPARRARAARGLGRLGDPIAIGPLIHALNDGQEEVREAAAEALGDIGSSDAVEPLITLLYASHPHLSPLAARTLGRIGGVESIRALLMNLGNADPASIRATVDALALSRHDAALLPLLQLCHETEDEDLRQHILDALAAAADLTESDPLRDVANLFRNRRPPHRFQFYQ
jgi:MFS family permease